jgi:hypothetical protein
MYNIINLILGLIAAAGIPLGLLWLAIKYANKIDKNGK